MARLILFAAAPFFSLAAAQPAAGPVVWQHLSLTGPEAKLERFSPGYDSLSFGRFSASLGGGVLWFAGSAELETAPYSRLTLTARDARHDGLGLELSVTHARSRFRCGRSLFAAGFPPFPGEPPESDEPTFPPLEEDPEGAPETAVDPPVVADGTPAASPTKIRRRHRQSGDIWQLGIALTPRLLRAAPGGVPLILSGRIGASVTVFDFSCDRDISPGAFAGLLLEVSPFERVTLALEGSLHVIDADLSGERPLLGATAGLRLGVAF